MHLIRSIWHLDNSNQQRCRAVGRPTRLLGDVFACYQQQRLISIEQHVGSTKPSSEYLKYSLPNLIPRSLGYYTSFLNLLQIAMPAQLVAIPPVPAHNSLVVRSLLIATPEYRETILKDVEYNIFAFPAGLLTCDFLSDSGTLAMTDVQWAACK